MTLYSRPRPSLPPESALAGFRFPAEVIVVAVPCTPRAATEPITERDRLDIQRHDRLGENPPRVLTRRLPTVDGIAAPTLLNRDLREPAIDVDAVPLLVDPPAPVPRESRGEDDQCSPD